MTCRVTSHQDLNLYPPPPRPPNAPLQHPPLHCTQLTSSVIFATLCLLWRLRTQFIAVRESSGHHLFISALTIASEVICSDTYSNKSWCTVGQGTFALQEVSQMEWEICAFLEWQLNVEPNALGGFEAMVRMDSRGLGSYPVPSGPFAHTKPSTNNNPTAIPSFGPGAPPSPPPMASIPTDRWSRRSSADTYPVPMESKFPTALTYCSNLLPPADSTSPVALPNYYGDTVKIISSAGSNLMQMSGRNIPPSPPYHCVHMSKYSISYPSTLFADSCPLSHPS